MDVLRYRQRARLPDASGNNPSTNPSNSRRDSTSDPGQVTAQLLGCCLGVCRGGSRGGAGPCQHGSALPLCCSTSLGVRGLVVMACRWAPRARGSVDCWPCDTPRRADAAAVVRQLNPCSSSDRCSSPFRARRPGPRRRAGGRPGDHARRVGVGHRPAVKPDGHGNAGAGVAAEHVVANGTLPLAAVSVLGGGVAAPGTVARGPDEARDCSDGP